VRQTVRRILALALVLIAPLASSPAAAQPGGASYVGILEMYRIGDTATALTAVGQLSAGQVRKEITSLVASERKALKAGKFVSILGEFRDRYVLSYSPEGVSTPGWHEITVTVKGKPVTVTARRGYVAQ